jgi:uncharacterized protein
MPPNLQKFFIGGPAGRLETVLAEPKSNQRGLAIIAHPHPLYGGTMDNKIVHIIFNTLLESGFLCVKFNFRGVKRSEGVHDHGKGEIDDIISVVETVRDQFTVQSDPLLLAGFSFGGAIQAHVAQQLNPQNLILVAPSVTNLNAPPVTQYCTNTLIIHGDQDEIVPLQSILAWAEPQSLPVVVIPGAAHFFHGNLLIIKRIILDACRNNERLC